MATSRQGRDGPDVDVVVVAYNSAATIGATLDSARSCLRVRSVIVVDNASQDDTIGHCRGRGADLIIENPDNAGFSRAVNRGLQHCSAPFILLLNPDARIDAEALDRLCTALQANPRAAAAGPVLFDEHGNQCLGARRFSTASNRVFANIPLLRSLAGLSPEYRRADELIAGGAVIPVDYLWGAALLCRRDVLARFGGLDERYFLYAEDEDFGRLARRHGYSLLLVPSARVLHHGATSSAGDKSLIRARQAVANDELLRKWSGPLPAWAFRQGIIAAHAARASAFALLLRRDKAREEVTQLRLTLKLLRARLRQASTISRPAS